MESTLELSVPEENMQMNSTGIDAERVGDVSPIKSINEKSDEEWLASFLDVMDSSGDDSKFKIRNI